MSKVTEELNFLWRERALDYYNEVKRLSDLFEGKPNSNFYELEGMRSMLEIQGLIVEGIEE